MCFGAKLKWSASFVPDEDERRDGEHPPPHLGPDRQLDQLCARFDRRLRVRRSLVVLGRYEDGHLPCR